MQRWGRKRRKITKHNCLRCVELGTAKKLPPGLDSLVKLSRIQGQESVSSVGIPWLGYKNVVGVQLSTCVRANALQKIRYLQNPVNM